MPKISLVAPDPNSFITAVSGAKLTRIQDSSYLYVDPKNPDNIFWYNAGDLQIIPPFSINNISGMQLWLDGKDPLNNGNPPADGTSIDMWKDKSGKKNDMKAQKAATYTASSNSLNFNRSLYNSINTLTYPIDVFVIVKLNDINSHYDICGLDVNNGDDFNSLTFGEVKRGHWQNGSSGGSRNAIASSAETSTNFLLMQWSIDDKNFYIKRNGTQIVFNNSHTWNQNPHYFQLGSRHYNDRGGTLVGSISEVLAFDSQLNTVQSQIIEGYLAWKWGLQSSLPDNHPYKSAAPSGSTAFPQTINYLENVSFVRIAPSNSDSGMSYIEISQIVIKDDKDVNIAKTGAITQKGGQASLLQNYPLQKLIDGNEQILEWPNQWAPIQNSPDAKTFFIEVALSKPTNIKEVNILTRQSTPWYFNSVMQTVQFLDSNRNLLATRSFPGNSATKQVINKLGPNIGTPGLIKFVRIERSNSNSKEGSIQIAQLQVFDLDNKNVAKYQIAKSKDGYPAEYAVDGVELNGPGDRGGQMSIANDWWELTLGAPTAIKQIKFFNRNCCYERMEPFRISLLDKDRNVIHNTSNFTKEGVQIFNITGKAAEKI
jgi:hypothetical protein